MYKGVRFSKRVKDLPRIGMAEPCTRGFVFQNESKTCRASAWPSHVQGVRFSKRVKDLPRIGKAEPYCRDFAAVRITMKFQSRLCRNLPEDRN